MQRGNWNGLLLGLNVVALASLLFERMIGDTILGNVVLVGLSITVLLAAVPLGLFDMLKRRNLRSSVTFAMSAVLAVYIAIRLASDSVPVGYGP